MLSASQIQILRLLDELSASSLTINDQQPQVATILELIQQLNDSAEYEQLIAPTTHQSPLQTFVQLCRRRLVSAQAQALTNYARKRELRTQIIVSPPETLADTKQMVENTGEESGSDLTESLQVAKSEDISQVLQRMHGMAQQEVFKSELNISELDMSSRTLRELQEKYSGVDLLLNASNQLVKVINEADAWERRYMMASMGFLALVMAYIVYRRILSGPIKLLLWGFLRLVGVAKFFVGSTTNDLSQNTGHLLIQSVPMVASATTVLATTVLSATAITSAMLTPSPINPPITPRIGGVRQNISFQPREAPKVTSSSSVHREL